MRKEMYLGEKRMINPTWGKKKKRERFTETLDFALLKTLFRRKHAQPNSKYYCPTGKAICSVKRI